MRATLLVVLLLPLLSSLATAQFTEFDVGKSVEVKLLNGDVLKGRLVSATGADVVIEHPLLGRMTIPAIYVDLEEPEPEPVEPESPWSGVFSLSGSGTSGNTKNRSGRIGYDALHQDDDGTWTINLSFFWYEDRHTTTEQNANAFFMHQWNLENSVWRPFVDFGGRYDKFQSYDFLGFAHIGAGYPFIETDQQTLVGQVGAGASQKFGLESAEPEGLVGADYVLNLDEKTRLTASAYYYPYLRDIDGEGRTRLRAQYETDIIPDSTWSFLTGFLHEYDARAGQGDKNYDLNYWIGLGYTF